ncbi:MAG: sulfite exporter TauE/SafE family protein [Oscillospiraceae bacterium]|nr:sulfite exporter TauE/SafE family protein [Oscillospiraceae bacterium]
MSWLVTTVVGFFSGVLASMGLGGGFILLVYLSLFTDIEQRTAQGVNLFFFIPIILLSLVFHIKNKLIDFRTALLCGAVGAATVYGGYALAQRLDNEWLRRGFAVFIILAGLRDLFAKGVDKQAPSE